MSVISVLVVVGLLLYSSWAIHSRSNKGESAYWFPLIGAAYVLETWLAPYTLSWFS